MKSFTDLEQSKKLKEILSLESADMCYIKREINDTFIETPIVKPIGGVDKSLCCWSLTALLGVLPNYQLQTQDDGTGILCSCKGKFNIITADNPVDACFEMILKLHGLNLL